MLVNGHGISSVQSGPYFIQSCNRQYDFIKDGFEIYYYILFGIDLLLK